jgi:hypothetical protein
MKRSVLIAALFCLLLSVAQAQEIKKRQLVVPLESAGFVAFKIETVASGAQSLQANASEVQAAVNPQVLLASNNVIHRTLVDNEGNFIFGYDLVIEPVPFTRQFKVSVRPLSPDFERQLRARTLYTKQGSRPGLNVSTLPHPADAQIIEDGDGFALDLLVNSSTGVKIVDVVRVSFDRSKLWAAPSDTPARDFTLDSVELAVKDYDLLVDGERIAGGKQTRGATGALLWLYLPERGRFIFSLMPREGYDFQKVGRVEDNKISFTFGGKHYEWISSAPIIGRGGNWNIWVMLDTSFVPDFPSARETTAGGRTPAKQRFRMGELDPHTLGIKSAADVAARQAAVAPKTDSQSTTKEDEPGAQLRGRARVQVGSADRMENLIPKK